MAYTEGTASDQFDLLGKIKLFLEDNGWTTAMYASDSTGVGTTPTEVGSNAKRLHIHKNGKYLNFRSTQQGNITHMGSSYYRWGIGFNIGTGFDANATWGAQPGVATTASSNGTYLQSMLYLNSSVSYRMFLWDSPFTFFIYIKNSSTAFGQMYFGEIYPKYGAWDGGTVFLSNHSYVQDYWSESEAISRARSNFFINSGNFTSYDTSSLIGAANIISIDSHPWPMCGGGFYGGYKSNNFFKPSLLTSIDASTNDYNNNHLLRLLAAMPSAFNVPIILLPIQPVLIRSQSTYKYSFLGEFPYMKLTMGGPSLIESVVTYGGKKYILLPMGYTTYANRVLLAVEYEGA
jgi:hypothetical protein